MCCVVSIIEEEKSTDRKQNMGAGASVNQDSLNSLKDEAAKPADGNDAADAKSAVLSLRKLISESGVGNFKQFKEEAGKPLDGIDIADDGKAELVRLRKFLTDIFSPEAYKKAEEALTQEMAKVTTEESGETAAAPAENPEGAETTESAPAAVEEASGPATVEEIKVTQLTEKWDECISVHKKWPLFLDSNDSKPVAAFLGYQTVLPIDAKKGMVEASIKKSKTIEAVREEWRSTVVKAMLKKSNPSTSFEAEGGTVWLHLGSSATDFKGKFCGDDFPLDFFSCTKMSEEETKMKFVKEEELKGTNETLGRWGEKFQVIVTSDFQLEDYQEFLENSVPLDMLKVYNVKMDS